MSLLLTLNVFHTIFQSFYCWPWTGNCLLTTPWFSTKTKDCGVCSQKNLSCISWNILLPETQKLKDKWETELANYLFVGISIFLHNSNAMINRTKAPPTFLYNTYMKGSTPFSWPNIFKTGELPAKISWATANPRYGKAFLRSIKCTSLPCVYTTKPFLFKFSYMFALSE